MMIQYIQYAIHNQFHLLSDAIVNVSSRLNYSY